MRVMSSTYGDVHFVLDGGNEIESGELHSKGASIPVSRVSTTFLIVMHPRRETQVMHFIARFNSSVRLFNQTFLRALVLNVGGCDPFRATPAARRERTGGDENHFVRRIRPRAIGTSHPFRASLRGGGG